MTDTAARITDALRHTGLFERLPEASVEHLAKQMNTFSYDEGEQIIEGDTRGQLGRMYVVLSGTAEARVDDTVVGSFGPGDHFGEMSLLDGGPRSATVVATSALELAGLSSWNLRASIEEDPALAIHLIEVLAQRLRVANTRLAND